MCPVSVVRQTHPCAGCKCSAIHQNRMTGYPARELLRGKIQGSSCRVMSLAKPSYREPAFHVFLVGFGNPAVSCNLRTVSGFGSNGVNANSILAQLNRKAHSEACQGGVESGIDGRFRYSPEGLDCGNIDDAT